MTDPVTSPDGKWMWTGAEWIPAPPTEEPLEKEKDPSFVDNMRGIKVQDSVLTGNENLISIAPIAVDRNKSTYVVIVLIILIGATVGGYLLMNRELEEASQDYWSNHNYGFRFTDDDVYVLVNSLEFEHEQECESLINDENWSLIEMNSGLCVFDSILFNATIKEDGYQTLCFASSCVRLDFEGDALYSTSILNDGNTNGHCHLSVRWGGSVNSNSSVYENFNERLSHYQTFLPAHCYSLLGLDDLHDNIRTTGLDLPSSGGTIHSPVGKVTIMNVFVDSSENFMIYFRLSAGSDDTADFAIRWEISCIDGNYITGNFSDSTIFPLDGGASVVVATSGVGYRTAIDADDGAGNDCGPNALFTSNEKATLYIHVVGGGTTYDILNVNDDSVGAVVA